MQTYLKNTGAYKTNAEAGESQVSIIGAGIEGVSVYGPAISALNGIYT